MPFSGVVVPEQLQILRAVLDAYCKQNNLLDPLECEAVAHRIMALYLAGAKSLEELAAALAREAPKAS